MTRETTGRSTKKTTSRGTKKAAPKRSAKKKAAPKRKAKVEPMTALDAAARVLREAGEPLGCSDMVQRMLDNGYWVTQGKTPANTLYAAVLREVTRKGKDSRFKKVGRGLFALT